MKKILAFANSFTLAFVSIATTVSCTTTKYKWPFEEGSITTINTPLKFSTDDVEANWDYTTAKKKHLDDKYTLDYGIHDEKVGSYEVLKAAFEQVGKTASAKDFSNTIFTISKSNAFASKPWKMLANFENKNYYFNFDIEEGQKINISLSTIIKNNKIQVNDGSDQTIINELKRINELDSSFDLKIDKRLWLRNQDARYSVETHINDHGSGYIFVYSPNYEGRVKVDIEIKNYQANQFEHVENPYSYYDTRTQHQIEKLDNIDKNIEQIEFSKDRRVILLGLDGLNYDNFEEYVLNNDNFQNKSEIKATYNFDINSFESVFGWRQALTGSISGIGKSIFEITKSAKNGEEMSIAATTMWNTFRTKILSDEAIKRDFNENGYIGLVDDDTKQEVPDEYSQTGKIWSDTIFKDTNNISNEEIASLKYKVSKAFEISKELFDGQKPNLFFEYDTITDNMGHAGVKYDTLAYKAVTDEYAKILNYWFSKEYEKDLVILVTDHGRNSNDVSHQGYDNSTRKSFIVSNQNLESFSTTKEINLYAIKEIIYNFMKEEKNEKK